MAKCNLPEFTCKKADPILNFWSLEWWLTFPARMIHSSVQKSVVRKFEFLVDFFLYFKVVKLFKFPPILKCTLFHFLALNNGSADNLTIEAKIAQLQKKFDNESYTEENDTG